MADATQVDAIGPFAGLRVLDLTSVVLGPLATQTLGDMGADVIKIEGPDGDIMRHAQPMKSAGMGAVFLNVNRNKRSLGLDLKTTGAKAIMARLIAKADVLIHSMRPQAIARLGLTYDAVAAIKPDIIYCATIGFSARGPYAERPAYDDIIQAQSGFSDLSRRRSGGAPELAPSIIADKICGLTAYGAITTALYHRERTGQGQAIEVPMFETMTAFTLAEHLDGHVYVPPEGDFGYARCLSPNRRAFETADGYLAALPYTTRHWQAFFRAAGRDDMADDPTLADPGARSRNIDRLYATMADILRTKSTADWSVILRRADVPSVPVNRLEDLESDAHLEAIAFFQQYDHPSEGRIQTTAVPVQYSKSPGNAVRLHAPRLGEHTRSVLQEAGLTDPEIASAIDAGIAIAVS